ncbi:MAG: hypothetical protein H6651_15405 [Ardenticatenales bacterium]|nr:hypothetical protein [Ardenticatenales bacterium]
MELFVRLFTLVIYLSLLYELVGIPVPSIASTYQLFFTDDELNGDSLLLRVRRWPMVLKLVGLLLPTAAVVLIYLLPLLQAVWPRLSDGLHGVGPAGSLVLIVPGCLLAALGRFVGLSAAWRLHHDDGLAANQFDLQTRGLFALSRNPILLGMYFTFVGLWLLYPSLEMGLGFLLFLANMHFRVLLEEDFLRWRFGRRYEQFLAATRRYL